MMAVAEAYPDAPIDSFSSNDNSRDDSLEGAMLSSSSPGSSGDVSPLEGGGTLSSPSGIDSSNGDGGDGADIALTRRQEGTAHSTVDGSEDHQGSGREVVAAALNLVGSHAIFGRNWCGGSLFRGRPHRPVGSVGDLELDGYIKAHMNPDG